VSSFQGQGKKTGSSTSYGEDEGTEKGKFEQSKKKARGEGDRLTVQQVRSRGVMYAYLPRERRCLFYTRTQKGGKDWRNSHGTQ